MLGEGAIGSEAQVVAGHYGRWVRPGTDARLRRPGHDPPMPGRGRPLRVLVAGAGVAGLEALLALRSLAEERVSLELLAPAAELAYRPLAVAEPFGAGRARRFDVAGLAELVGARFRGGSLTAVDPGRRIVRTSHGEALAVYDVLLLAIGARPEPALPGAVTFAGAGDAGAVRAVLEACQSGRARRLAFAVPTGVTWALPIYELALLTDAYLAARSTDRELTVVTPEREPLELFGPAASAAVRDLLERRGIRLVAGVHPLAAEEGALRVVPGRRVRADRVVALPRLVGPRIAGVPQTRDGFVRTDAFGRVKGLADVFAAGDVTDFPVKQGGIAAQQAEVAARTIAALAGAPVEPEPFRPVLRGLLVTGAVPRYLEASLDWEGEGASVDVEPLWWPATKIASRYLAPFLAAHAGLAVPAEPPGEPEAVPVDVSLETAGPAA
ncbi:MAG TPA: FAD-dependent oxidoreductase [Gaiellaceae bacterium]|nr:FAD-dependent oxidoreductase [Gaiellaceae bacterium]